MCSVKSMRKLRKKWFCAWSIWDNDSNSEAEEPLGIVHPRLTYSSKTLSYLADTTTGLTHLLSIANIKLHWCWHDVITFWGPEQSQQHTKHTLLPEPLFAVPAARRPFSWILAGSLLLFLLVFTLCCLWGLLASPTSSTSCHISINKSHNRHFYWFSDRISLSISDSELTL